MTASVEVKALSVKLHYLTWIVLYWRCCY